MELPCTRPDSRELVKIKVNDICYIDLVKGDKIRFNTIDGLYLFRLSGSLEACTNLFDQFGFHPLDSVNVVNMSMVKFIKVSMYSRIAYFNEQETVSTSVSRNGLRKVKEEFPKITIIEV